MAGGKSDTSSRAGPVPFKNPLLSMQVTGLTLDDFAHNAMLLPAAPAPMLEVSREPETTDIKKPLVFSSIPPELQDPDSFSEIDLHSTPSQTAASTTATTIEYNPLQDLDLDPTAEPPANANGFVQQTSSITAQFAAQLPNVASTVFSTFSRVIKGTSPGPQQQPPQTPAYVPQPVEAAAVPAAYDYSHQPQDSAGYPEVTPVAPTFFNPGTVGPAVPPPAAIPVGGSNSYRLGGAKKKTYAHIPGLSSAGPLPTVVKAPEQVPIPEVTESQPEPQPAKGGLSFFEKIPNLLEKIPKPVGFASTASQPEVAAPSPIDYFGGQPPVVQPSYGPPEVPPLNQPRPPSGEPETLPPPPTFFSPGQIASVPNLPQNQPSKNPYSSSRLSRGVGLYKNPLVPPAPVAAPTFLPNQEPPRSFFQPPLPAEHPAQPQPTPTPDTVLSNSRPHSALSSSQLFAAATFEPAPEPAETKTVLDSRSKSTENVLSPPPRPNSNLSEPAGLFIESRPLSVFKQPEPAPEANFFNPTPFNQPQQVQPPPPTTGSLGSNPYNLQKTRKPAYAVPPSLAPANFFQPAANFFNPPAQVALFNPAPVEPPPAAFFNPQPEPPASIFNPVPVEPVVQTPPPAAFFNPITVPTPAPQTQSPVSNDFNANPNLIAPVPVKTQDINANLPSQQPPAPTTQVNDLNANFFNLQLAAPPAQAPPTNPVDFFNTPEQPTATGQTQSSSVPLFSFFGQPERPAHPPPPTQPAAPAVSFFGQQQQEEEPGTDESDGQQVPIIEPEEEEPEIEGEQEANQAGGSSNAVNDSQLDDRYDDPSEQERIGNAPEPIFSSDNLFEFKKSAFEDDTYSKDVLIDANSSSMAAMTATATTGGGGAGGGPVAASSSSVAAASATNNAADTSIHETPSSTAATSSNNVAYRPIYRHWFFRREIEGKTLWTPFSMTDSLALEDALPLVVAEEEEEVIVHVDGGRHDVSVRERKMTPVYWKGATQEVRRCSWFYKNVESRFVPYGEEVAELLEREYKEAATSGEWHRRVVLPNGETVVFHGASVIVHFLQTQNPEAWGGSSPVPATTNRPRVVKRGVDEFNIEDGEPERVDHLLFMVHGIGEACDLRFRPVEEVVDEFRSISAQLVQSHYRSSFDRGDIGRVEILPISWHNDLHSEESGIDKKLKAITLESIPKLRNFTNDTVLDVLFYTSPVFCQNIIDAVGKSLNRLYTLFLQRNPNFGGGVSLAGHSLGSLILFDLLCHQKGTPMETENSENPDGEFSIHPNHRPLSRKCSQKINYEVGPAGTGQPYIAYPQLLFHPKSFFALGSPIGMFVTVRGIDALGLDFKLPTCDGFFNIFHPYDPVAYRIEALVNPELSQLRPVLIPHHKGRKRMHLELKETMLRVGTDLKQRVLDTFRNTMDAVFSITHLNRPDPKAIAHEVDKVIEDQLKFETGSSTVSSAADLDTGETDLPLGKLNGTRRVDYVLQEAPLEFFNEYIFALTSHVCYWESEDTMLFLMKEIYSSLGVQSDSQIPQQSMTIERPIVSPTPSTSSQSNYSLFPQQQQQHQRPTSPGCNR
uniref:Putative phosphatidic acid-preferring phospholipase a1 n=1 Tax=Culex tarsalis TaxID=7177 RepID=A0A1Q3FIX4_CULTA